MARPSALNPAFASENAKAHLFFARCCRLLAFGSAMAGTLLLVAMTVADANPGSALLWNILFVAVPTMLLATVFGVIAGISSIAILPWPRILRNLMIGLAGAFCIPIGVAFATFAGKVTGTAGVYFLLGLAANYLMWREVQAVTRKAGVAKLQPAGAPDDLAVATSSEAETA